MAKPIVDIMVGLNYLEIDKNTIHSLAKFGYEYLGESGITGRLYLRKRHPEMFNLHLVKDNGEIWNNNRLFTNFLRNNKKAAIEYAEYKQKTLDRGITTLLAYSAEKQVIISKILERAKNKSIEY